MKYRTRQILATALLAQIAALGTASAQTQWDAGAGADTSINNPTNWNNDTLPANNGSATVSFPSGSSANFNVDYFFREVQLNRGGAFSLNSSGGNLVIRSSNSSSSYGITMSSGATVTQTINAPIRVSTNNADANKLLVIRNNNTNSSRLLDINGAIARSADSSADFQIRYEGVAGSVTRLDGELSHVTNLQQANGAWAGTLIVSSDRSLGSTNITAATTGTGVGAMSGSLVLGESSADVQSWGNLTLNNGLKVVVGGDISFSGFSNTATTSLVGATQAGDAVSKLTFNVASTTTIGAGITLGGGGAGENNLSLVKAGASSLTLAGSATYTGATRVEAGTLRLGAAERLADSGTLVLAGGTFDVNGFTETLGVLDLDGSGFLDLDDVTNATGSVSFAASSGADWGAFGLSITAATLGAQSIRFGIDALGLSAGQLANITVNGLGGWGIDSQGYLTAIPEPSSFAALAGLAALAGAGLRRRRRA